MDKPKGQFQCGACRQIWDGSQLYVDPIALLWTCGNLLCGGVVYRIKERSNFDRMDTAEIFGYDGEHWD